MNQKPLYFYQQQHLDIIYFAILTVVSYSVTVVPTSHKLLLGGIGLIGGIVAAQWSWQKIIKTLDGERRFKYYFLENLLFSSRFHLQCVGVAHVAGLMVLGYLWLRFTGVSYLMCAVSGLCLSRQLFLWFVSRQYERASGAIAPHEEYAPPGPNEIVGRRAEVHTDCDPVGKVQMGAEIWNAQSDKGDPLTRGARVRVVRQDGLMLYVAAG